MSRMQQLTYNLQNENFTELKILTNGDTELLIGILEREIRDMVT